MHCPPGLAAGGNSWHFDSTIRAFGNLCSADLRVYGKLFMAAVVPGVIALIGYMLVIRIVVTLNPGSRATWSESRASMRDCGRWSMWRLSSLCFQLSLSDAGWGKSQWH